MPSTRPFASPRSQKSHRTEPRPARRLSGVRAGYSAPTYPPPNTYIYHSPHPVGVARPRGQGAVANQDEHDPPPRHYTAHTKQPPPLLAHTTHPPRAKTIDGDFAPPPTPPPPPHKIATSRPKRRLAMSGSGFPRPYEQRDNNESDVGREVRQRARPPPPPRGRAPPDQHRRDRPHRLRVSAWVQQRAAAVHSGVRLADLERARAAKRAARRLAVCRCRSHLGIAWIAVCKAPRALRDPGLKRADRLCQPSARSQTRRARRGHAERAVRSAPRSTLLPRHAARGPASRSRPPRSAPART